MEGKWENLEETFSLCFTFSESGNICRASQAQKLDVTCVILCRIAKRDSTPFIYVYEYVCVHQGWLVHNNDALCGIGSEPVNGEQTLIFFFDQKAIAKRASYNRLHQGSNSPGRPRAIRANSTHQIPHFSSTASQHHTPRNLSTFTITSQPQIHCSRVTLCNIKGQRQTRQLLALSKTSTVARERELRVSRGRG